MAPKNNPAEWVRKQYWFGSRALPPLPQVIPVYQG